MLQPIADESRNIAPDMHRRRAASREEIHGRAEVLAAGLFALDHLDQRHEMRRIEKWVPTTLFAMFEMTPPFSVDGMAELNCWRELYPDATATFELGENLLLERQFLRRRLENEIARRNRVRRVVVNLDRSIS